MNFKLILLFAAVLCFGQGHAWFGDKNPLGSIWDGVKKKAEDFGNDIADKVKGGLNDAQESIKNAGSNLMDRVDAARKDAEDALRDKYNQARDEIEGAANKLQGEISSLTDDVMAKMDPSKIIDEAINMSNQIDVVVADVKSQVESAVTSATSGAQNRINAWDVVVKEAAAKAKDLGVDIKDCSADRVQQLGMSALKNAVGCLTNKIDEGKGLVNEFIGIGNEGHDIVNDIKAAYETCALKDNFDVVVCAGKEMIPLLKRIIALSNDTVRASAKAVTLVQTLQVSLSTCMTNVAAMETSKVPELTIDITRCIAGKIKEKVGSAAAA